MGVSNFERTDTVTRGQRESIVAEHDVLLPVLPLLVRRPASEILNPETSRAVWNLAWDNFESHGMARLIAHLRHLEEVLQQRQIEVATRGGEPLGYCTYQCFDQLPDVSRGHYDQIFGFAQSPELRIVHECSLSLTTRWPEKPVVLEYFDNSLTSLSPAAVIPGSTCFIGDLVVSADARRQSIGTRLVQAVEKRARQDGVPLIMASTLDGSGSGELLAKQGFVPILRYGPMGPSGGTMLLMGKELPGLDWE